MSNMSQGWLQFNILSPLNKIILSQFTPACQFEIFYEMMTSYISTKVKVKKNTRAHPLDALNSILLDLSASLANKVMPLLNVQKKQDNILLTCCLSLGFL